MTPSASGPAASVIVRAKNRVETIEATFQSLRGQTCPVEIIVVDSGSTDGTLAIAEQYADVLIGIPQSEFSYGRALNIGAEAAAAPIHFALSAHCVAPNPSWIELNLRHYQDEQVGAANGLYGRPAGQSGSGVFRPTIQEACRDIRWGFSNHASSWRASAWQHHRFREDLEACEDKEWSWRLLSNGWQIVFDPDIDVPSAHRRRDGVVASCRRTHREAMALAQLGRPLHPSLFGALRMWWSDFPHPSRWPRSARRFSPHRVAELWGSYAGTREGLRRA